MLRVMLVGLLVWVSLIVPPTAHADPQTCPPTCDQIPTSAWPQAESIPLNGTYRWPNLAEIATPTDDRRFKFEQVCAGPRRFDDPRDFAVAARAVVNHPAGQWQLQAQVLHWRGETWRGGQLATQVYHAAVADLRACQQTAPQFSPTITADSAEGLVAVISGPQIVRQYLIADVHSSTVVELALWADQGVTVPWPLVPDARVLEAMRTPLCAAYLGSCG